jgi:hypothetical protein
MIGEGAQDAAGERRWTLMTQLLVELMSWTGNYPSLAERVAEVVALTIGDSAVVILADLPGQDEPVVGFGHTNPENAEFGRKLVSDLGSEGLRDWVRQFRGREGRTHGTAFFEEPLPATLAPFAEFRSAREFADLVYAPVRSMRGELRGVIGCARDSGSSSPSNGQGRRSFSRWRSRVRTSSVSPARTVASCSSTTPGVNSSGCPTTSTSRRRS